MTGAQGISSRPVGARLHSGGDNGGGRSGDARSPSARNGGHTRRLSGWDYSKGASFFITISTEPRRPLFGKVSPDGEVALSPLGQEVLAALEAIPRFNPGIKLFGHVVMPDHVHFNCHLAAGLPEPLKSLGKAIRGFKAVTTRAYLTPSGREASLVEVGAHRAPTIWQESYHDHLCLSSGFIDSTERYIAYNGIKWLLMHGAGTLRIIEPISSPRLDLGEYWKGVGNLELLAPDRPMVSLRVSREVRDIAAVVARMDKAADKGYVVASGFVSKGEQAVRDMLCGKPGAGLIHVRTSSIPNARFRPESAYVQPFAEGRCLVLGKGNDDVAFDRVACLDVNREIIEMAQAGNGLSLYFKADGLYKLGSDSQWHKV